MRRIIAVASLFALASCGSSSPASPTFPSVAGSWSGTLMSSNFETMNVQFDLRQTDDIVTGTWTATAADWHGTIIGTVSTTGTLSGAITISAPPETPGGPRCSGQSTFGGSVTTSIFGGASPGFSGTCASLPQGVSIVTRR